MQRKRKIRGSVREWDNGYKFHTFFMFTLNRCNFMGRQRGLQDQLQLPVSIFTTFGPSCAIYLYFKHQKLTQLASSCVVCCVLYCHFYYLEDTRMPKTEGSVKENTRKARKKGKKKTATA